MGRKRYTPDQIIGKLREAEVPLAKGEGANQVCRTHCRADLPSLATGLQYGKPSQCWVIDTSPRGHTGDAQRSWLRYAPPGSLA